MQVQGQKHFLELAYSKHSVLKVMQATKLDDTLKEILFCFWEQSCAYLVKILPLTHTAEFCAKTDGT